MKHIQIFSALLLALFFASCSNSSDTTQNGGGSTVTWTIPTIGTEYVYQSQGVNGLPFFDTISIVQTGQHLGGKTNVITYADEEGTVIYNIEANGDISDGDPTTTAHGVDTITWTTFPTATHQPISDPVMDTTEGLIHIFQSDVRTYVGAETLTTTAGQFATLHVRETTIRIVTAPDSLDCNSSDTSVFDKWYAPTISLYVKVINSGTDDGVTSEPSDVDLIKYLPK